MAVSADPGEVGQEASQLEDSEGHRVPWATGIPEGLCRWSLE